MEYWSRDREAEYLADEAEFIEQARGRSPECAIALSGGGIRSAIFSLGALQSLAKSGLLEKIDYLSTVSGGGYLGGSLHWWWSGPNGSGATFGAGASDFPYGTDDPESMATSDTNQDKILGYLRSHGNYLTPGGGIGVWSGVGVVMRGVVLNLILWLILASFAVWLLLWLSVSGSSPVVPILDWILSAIKSLTGLTSPLPGWADVVGDLKNVGTACNVKAVAQTQPLANEAAECAVQLPKIFAAAIWLAYAIALLFLIYSITYSIGTFFGRLGKRTDIVNSFVEKNVSLFYKIRNRYFWRRLYESFYQIFHPIFFGLLVVGLVPVLHGLAYNEDASTQGLLMTGIGVASGLWGYYRSFRQLAPNLATHIALPIGSLLFLYGVAILAYEFAIVFLDLGVAGFIWLACLTAFAVVLGFSVNINHISPHRFYRDRLMEAFMPAWVTVDENVSAWSPAADGFRMSDAWSRGEAAAKTPFPIVNTNVVLVNEETKESLSPQENDQRRNYKLRGGDNFVLTPLACGSKATGWSDTESFMGDGMTLASATAISGAAANPDSGYLGSGRTRNRAVSVVMRLFNLRLGYWVPHPSRRLRRWVKPNHFWPGFWYAVTPFGHQSHCGLIELTDGGHFDNLGIYELIRRRAKLIVVCDGEADPKTAYNALISLVRRVEQDFKTKITFKTECGPELLVENEPMAYPSGAKRAKRGFFVAEVKYPKDGDKPKETGAIVYLKATMIDDVSLKTKGYKGANVKFPDQSTADQFFDEEQFEAYRELGYKIASSAVKELSLNNVDFVYNPRKLLAEAWTPTNSAGQEHGAV